MGVRAPFMTDSGLDTQRFQMIPATTSSPTTSNSVPHTSSSQPLVLHPLLVNWHLGVLLPECIDVLLVVEILRLQREPFRHRTPSADWFTLQPLRFDVVGAGDGPTIRTVCIRLPGASRATVNTAVNRSFCSHS